MKNIQFDDAFLSDLFKQLALLMHSGIRLSDTLFIISERKDIKGFEEFFKALAEDIESGTLISEAFENTGAFSFHVIGFLRTSEQAGKLEETFESLSHYYEDKYRRKKKLIDALTYPCILLILMLVIIVVLLTQVLPIFNDIYVSLGGGLTGVAKGLLTLGNALNTALPYVGLVFGITLIIGVVVYMVKPLRDSITKVFVRGFGDKGIYKKMNNAAFAQTLSVSVSSGLTFEEGVSLSSELFNNNPGAKARCNKCLELLENGIDLDEALLESGFLSNASAYLLKLSMNSGQSDEMMLSIADRMTEEADESVNSLLSKIEPSLVITTSMITGLILLTVMLPLIDIMKTIG